MTRKYKVKVAFWLQAFEAVDVEAASDAEAIVKAKAAAVEIMTSQDGPSHVDYDERRQGVIAYIDRYETGDNDREVVAENVRFEDDRVPEDRADPEGVKS